VASSLHCSAAMASAGGPAVACSRADRRAIRLLAAAMDCTAVVVVHTMLASYLDAHPELRAVVERGEAANSVGSKSDAKRPE
jgi:hypothetical protein